MVPGDHPETSRMGGGSDSHWVQWHAAYEDPTSNLSLRLRTVDFVGDGWNPA